MLLGEAMQDPAAPRKLATSTPRHCAVPSIAKGPGAIKNNPLYVAMLAGLVSGRCDELPFATKGPNANKSQSDRRPHTRILAGASGLSPRPRPHRG